MNRFWGLSGLKSLEQFKCSPGSRSGAPNARTLSSSSQAPSDSISSGSFVNLKLTAEKLVKEQASAKTDLELANSKLKKMTEQIGILQEKLQNAFNENAKLKVKQKEDEKLWKGLESKFSLTKSLCDQLTETLQQLNVQVQHAEKDKAFFEDKLSATSVALDKLHKDMKSTSLRLESSEETIKTRERELMELGLAKEKMETSFIHEQNRAARLIEEKDVTIKQLEEDVAAKKMDLESLASDMEKLHIQMKAKEDVQIELSTSKGKLESENKDLLSSNTDFANRLEKAHKQIKNLKDFVNMLVVKFTELENQSLIFSERLIHLNASFDSCFKLAQQEKDLVSKCAKQKLVQIHNQCTSVISEKNALRLVNQELNNKLLELQKEQEFVMVQHAEECRLAEDKIRKLESEAGTLVSKQTEMQALIVKLEDDLRTASENSRLSDKKMQDLLLKHSDVENESKRLVDELKADILEKQDKINLLQNEVEKSDEDRGLLEKAVSKLEKALKENNQLVMELQDRERQYTDQKAEIMASLANTESKLEEAKKEYDQMLESKHLELSKHLKEISQRNDQAINDIQRKYEAEKQETVNLEREKAHKTIQEMERACEKKITECKEESRQHLLQVEEEHIALVSKMQMEHANKEMGLISKHTEELKCTQLQAETELREKTKLLRSEHEAQLRALRCEHEDEYKRLQEELDIQKAKEEKQRAYLQMAWKVMGSNPEEDQEVNSRKMRSHGQLNISRIYSAPSAKMRNRNGVKRTQHHLDKTEVEEKESPYLKPTQTPVSNLLKNVDNVNTGSAISLPKHSRKVTHHEYEIETSNGTTITKRRKTKSTVMFGDPRKHRKRNTPKAKTPKAVVQGVKGGIRPNAPNIGDLFTEGSLNPYTDDPYAFD